MTALPLLCNERPHTTNWGAILTRELESIEIPTVAAVYMAASQLHRHGPHTRTGAKATRDALQRAQEWARAAQAMHPIDSEPWWSWGVVFNGVLTAQLVLGSTHRFRS